MKKIVIIGFVALLLPLALFAQLKRQDQPVSIREELTKPANSYLGISLLDPSRFSMSQSVSMSYLSMGGRGVAQNVYLNTMRYQIANPLLLTVQWGIQQFPYNSFDKNSPVFKSGFFVSGAELKYKPNKNIEMSLQYNSMPYYNNRYYYNHLGFPRFQSFEQDWNE